MDKVVDSDECGDKTLVAWSLGICITFTVLWRMINYKHRGEVEYDICNMPTDWNIMKILNHCLIQNVLVMLPNPKLSATAGWWEGDR